MTRFFTLKALAALVGAVLIGALGNAAWEYLLKPFFPWVSDFVLDVATLGIQSYRDEIYAEVAKGNLERSAIAILAFVDALPAAFFLFCILALALRKQLKSVVATWKAEVESAVIADRIPRSLIFSLGLFAVVCSFIEVSFVRTIYVVRPANHLDQFQRIIAPYLTLDQRLLVASRVAQMTNEAQYRLLVSEMTGIAQRNHLTIPTFDIR